MRDLEFDDINHAQLYIIKQLFDSGLEVETRGLKTLECAPVFFSIRNPRRRITTLKGRKWNFGAALGELSWHLAASNDLEFISMYLSNWTQFSEDKVHITESCYGFKIFKKNDDGYTKWEEIVNLLKKDPHSRRAVISLLSSELVINVNDLDVPCTTSLQFLVRNNKLDLFVNMRSNDIIWGVPYDFFFFSFLQELMSIELGVELGKYYHFATSMHIYERHFELGKRILSFDQQELEDFNMPEIPDLDYKKFIAAEFELRSKNYNSDNIKNLQIDPYWRELLMVLFYFNLKNIPNSSVTDNYYAPLLK